MKELTVNFDHKAVDVLQALKKATKVFSTVRVLRDAIALYDWLRIKHAEGYTLMLMRSQEKPIKVVLPFKEVV